MRLVSTKLTMTNGNLETLIPDEDVKLTGTPELRFDHRGNRTEVAIDLTRNGTVETVLDLAGLHDLVLADFALEDPLI